MQRCSRRIKLGFTFSEGRNLQLDKFFSSWWSQSLLFSHWKIHWIILIITLLTVFYYLSYLTNVFSFTKVWVTPVYLGVHYTPNCCDFNGVLTAITQECCKQYWTSPGGSTPQNSSCTATYHPPFILKQKSHFKKSNLKTFWGLVTNISYCW